MTDETQKAEELLQGSKEQSRHTSEPAAPEANDDEFTDRTTAIAAALLDVEHGEIPENINIRDARLKALLVGLEESDELDDIVGRLGGDLEDATQSDLARLLIRLALQEELPDVLDDAKEANRRVALEQANDF